MHPISLPLTKPFLAPQTKIEPVHRMAWLWTPPLESRAVLGRRKRARTRTRELLQDPPVNKLLRQLLARLNRPQRKRKA